MRHSAPGPEDAFTELDQALTRATEVDAEPVTTHRPRNLLLSMVFGMSVLLLSSVIGYTAAVFAVNRAEAHTDQRVAVLERDLQQRRATAAAQNEARDQQIAELRRLVCLFADHSQPRDPAVEDVRRRYNCTGSPSPTPGPSRT